MLDRYVIGDFLDEEFVEAEINIPEDIEKTALVEAFCQFVEDDFYEWLKDNYNNFTNRNNPEWDWIRGLIRRDETSMNSNLKG